MSVSKLQTHFLLTFSIETFQMSVISPMHHCRLNCISLFLDANSVEFYFNLLFAF